MATMLRLSIPDDDGIVAVSTGVVAYTTCAATELAVLVGDTVPRYRLGSEFRAFLERWAEAPRSAAAPGAGNKLVYAAAPRQDGEAVAGVITAQATAPTESQWGVVVGETAAGYLDRQEYIYEAVRRAMKHLTTQFGV